LLVGAPLVKRSSCLGPRSKLQLTHKQLELVLQVAASATASPSSSGAAGGWHAGGIGEGPAACAGQSPAPASPFAAAAVQEDADAHPVVTVPRVRARKGMAAGVAALPVLKA